MACAAATPLTVCRRELVSCSGWTAYQASVVCLASLVTKAAARRSMTPEAAHSYRSSPGALAWENAQYDLKREADVLNDRCQ